MSLVDVLAIVVGYVLGSLVGWLGPDAPGMHDALRDAFPIEPGELLNQVKVVEQHGRVEQRAVERRGGQHRRGNELRVGDVLSVEVDAGLGIVERRFVSQVDDLEEAARESAPAGGA